MASRWIGQMGGCPSGNPGNELIGVFRLDHRIPVRCGELSARGCAGDETTGGRYIEPTYSPCTFTATEMVRSLQVGVVADARPSQSTS